MKFVGVLVVALVFAHSTRESDGLSASNLHEGEERSRSPRNAILVLRHPNNGPEAQPRAFQSAGDPSSSSSAASILSRIFFRQRHEQQQQQQQQEKQEPEAEEDQPHVRIRITAAPQQMSIGRPQPSSPQYGFRRAIMSQPMQVPSRTRMIQAGPNGNDDNEGGWFTRIIKVTPVKVTRIIHRIKMFFTPNSDGSVTKSTSTRTYKTTQYGQQETIEGGNDYGGYGGQSSQQDSVISRILKTMRNVIPF